MRISPHNFNIRFQIFVWVVNVQQHLHQLALKIQGQFRLKPFYASIGFSQPRNSSFNFRVVLCRIRLFPTLISIIKWCGSELPLSFKDELTSFRMTNILSIHSIRYTDMKKSSTQSIIFLTLKYFDQNRSEYYGQSQATVLLLTL